MERPMVWGIRVFKQQYFVAISLFAEIENARKAYIAYKDPNFYGTFAIKLRQEDGSKVLGWAHISEHASATPAWNEDMREKRLTFAVWQEGRPYEWWEGRPPPDPKTVDDVQLTVVYETLEKYEREAVNAAWQKLLEGHPGYIEWYDASPDKRWTKFFRPRSSGVKNYYQKARE